MKQFAVVYGKTIIDGSVRSNSTSSIESFLKSNGFLARGWVYWRNSGYRLVSVNVTILEEVK